MSNPAARVPSLFRWLLLLALAFALNAIALGAPAAKAQAWASYRLGTVSFQAPADWKVTRRARDRSFTFESPAGEYQFEAYWWFPDEPLLAGDDIVSHEKITVQGKPATYIYSAFPGRQVLLLAFDEARADKRQFLMRLESEKHDFSAGSQVFNQIAATIRFTQKASAQPPQPVVTPPTPSADPGAAQGGWKTFADADAGLALRYPSGWKKATAQRDGVSIATFAAPDKRALALVAAFQASAERSVAEAMEAYETLYYGDYVLPDSIAGNGDVRIGDLQGAYVEMIGQIYAIEGVTLPFSQGRSWFFKAQDGKTGYVVALVSDVAASQDVWKVLSDIAESVRVGPDAGSRPGTQPAEQRDEAPADPAWPTPTTQAQPAIPGELAALGRRFATDCRPADPAGLPPEIRQVIAARPQAHFQWALVCRQSTYPVLGIEFDYDPRGATDDFFHPLYWDLLQANRGRPYALVVPRDGLLVQVLSPGPDEIAYTFDDVPPITATLPPVTATPQTSAGTQSAAAAATPDDMLGEGQTQDLALFDGHLEGTPWSKYGRPRDAFATYAQIKDGVLVVDIPGQAGTPQAGLYTTAPVVWLDRFGAGAETRARFRFDPARTDNFNVALATHFNLDGNDPGGAVALLSWAADADGGARVTFTVNGKKAWDIRTKTPLPEEVSLVLTPGASTWTPPGLPLDDTPWQQVRDRKVQSAVAAEGQGFRLYAYAKPPAKNAPARMALTRVDLTRKAGAPVSAPMPAAGVAPLPVRTLFAGKPEPLWEAAGTNGGDFKAYGTFSGGRMLVDIPAKKAQWPRAGLLSATPVVVLDERVDAIAQDMIVTVDPKATTGLLVMFNSNKVADMWRQSMAGAVSLVRAMDRDGAYILTLRSGDGPYGVWERAVPADFIENAWDGRLVIRFGNGWMAARLPGGPSVRGTGFRTGPGYEVHAAIYSTSHKPYGAARLALQSVTTGWESPDGMSAADRWLYVDRDTFDPKGFIADAAREVPAPEGGARVPGGLIEEMISVPVIRPAPLPQIAPDKQGALWPRLKRLAASLNPVSPAFAAKDCSAAIDAHLEETRRIEITLGEQPDVAKSFLSLGETLIGSTTLSGADAEAVRAQLSRALTAMHDGIAIGEDWTAGDDTAAAIHVMQAALNVGLSSGALQDNATFRQSVGRNVRATWAKAMKDLPKDKAEKLIIETARKFNPGARIDASGIYEEILNKGPSFDLGTVFGQGLGGSGDTRADISAAAWTLTNNTLATFSPHYKIAKAVADTMLESAKATKAFVVNDRVREMYKAYKEQVLKNGGMGDKDFYDAFTVMGDRMPINEMIAMMRTSPDQKISEQAAEAKLQELFRKWYQAETEAGKKSDRLAGLKDRYSALSCPVALGRSVWPDRYSRTSKAWSDLTSKGSYADRAVKTWNNYWDSCAPEIQLLDKYAELEAKTRAAYLDWLPPGNACADKARVDHDVDRLMCRLLENGENDYRTAMKEQLVRCGAIAEPDAATKAERADHIFDRLVKINHARQMEVFKALGITPPDGLYNCLCHGAGYGSPQTHQYYHPDFIKPQDKRYSCNQTDAGNPCIVSGYGCTRHPLPTDRGLWERCMARHKFDMTTGQDGKIDPASGVRLDQKIEQQLRDIKIGR